MKRKSPTSPFTNATLYFKKTAWREIQERAKSLDLSASQYLRKLAQRDIEIAEAQHGKSN